MPSSRLVVQVFVSSPSDVAPEREALETIVSELNTTWSGRLGVFLELIKWETHTHAAFSSDPQSAINDQIGNTYDVFLGVLWSRFGTKTPRAESGTLEEFSIALNRYKQEGMPEIMIYFKDAPIPPFTTDLEQQGKVNAFRKQIGPMGGLYSSFVDMSSFEMLLRSHLSAIAHKFSRSGVVQKIPSVYEVAVKNQAQSIDVLEIHEDDFGFLDYLEIYEDRLEEMNAALSAMTDATLRVGEQTNKRTAEMKEIDYTFGNVSAAKKFIRKSAEDFSAYAESMAKQIPLFATSRTVAFEALSESLKMQMGFDKSGSNDMTSIVSGLESLLESIYGSKEGIAALKEGAKGIPRLTVELNRAKRSAINQLDSFLSELEITAGIIRNLRDAASSMVN